MHLQSRSVAGLSCGDHSGQESLPGRRDTYMLLLLLLPGRMLQTACMCLVSTTPMAALQCYEDAVRGECRAHAASDGRW